jgi:hypothetical protein
MFYHTTNHIEVYKSGVRVDPTNADRSSGKLRLKNINSNLTAYMPTVNSTSGTNVMYKPEKKIYFSMDGDGYIDLIISAQIFVSFEIPSMTADELYDGPDFVKNLALLLNVPPEKFLSARIVRENSNKRSTGSAFIEIILIPSADSSSKTNSDPVTRTADYKVMQEMAASLYLGIQSGRIIERAQSLLNITILSATAQQTPCNPNSPATVPLPRIGGIILTRSPSECREKSPCGVQPTVSVVDDSVRSFILILMFLFKKIQ